MKIQRSSIFILVLIPMLLTAWSWGKKDENKKVNEQQTQSVNPNPNQGQTGGGYNPSNNPAQALQGWKDVYRIQTVRPPVLPPRTKYAVAGIPIRPGKIPK